ncbi:MULTISPECIES: hypothetical protein [unclassified Streptomyces]|uniref:Sulfate adenylyltransferase n=1 Tax=Streptomyces evansiae TaxID=3075535 RepID=A0ABD5DZX0_9ACTN|nr:MULTISPECIES: hypothetical protein [unclassified Streptomyces]MDT0414650.1 hypothetical protein [Streptomyces sp. DSM 41982]MYX20016.1 hypothetical protein [Streptomyces sp. SID8380]NJA56363.1 hypothetical protein [Streptomyces sp. NEAU-H3]WEH30523.1 hypothetical protein P0D76_26130 [Streptomyces sp. AM 3-1-1]SCD54526.1 hypothetical protein GA0115246_102967 [Streptomyces sp. SolWspMP-sol7th]
MTSQGAVAVRGTDGARAAGFRVAAVPGDGSPVFRDVYGGFAKEGGRVGSGALGAGTGGVARCV